MNMKTPSKKQMIEDLVEDVITWDSMALLEFVQNAVRDKYNQMSLKELRENWKDACTDAITGERLT